MCPVHTFWFTARVGLGKQDSGRPMKGEAGLEGLQLLVVMTSSVNRRKLLEEAGQWGMAVECVDTGAQALERLRALSADRKPYDLVVLDQDLPDMEGLDLADRIDREGRLTPPRMILLTAIGQRGQGEQARRAGVAGCLTKPIRPEQMRQCMLAVVEGKAGGEGSGLVTRHTLAELEARHRPRILLAEDNPSNQKVTVKMLEKLGCRADVANNGLEAMRAVQQSPYEMILMDCQMPEMDGYVAAAAIRQLGPEGGSDSLPIVAMTADVMEENRNRCLEAGMSDFLGKPFSIDELEAMVRRWTAKPAPKSGPSPK